MAFWDKYRDLQRAFDTGEPFPVVTQWCVGIHADVDDRAARFALERYAHSYARHIQLLSRLPWRWLAPRVDAVVLDSVRASAFLLALIEERGEPTSSCVHGAEPPSQLPAPCFPGLLVPSRSAFRCAVCLESDVDIPLPDLSAPCDLCVERSPVAVVTVILPLLLVETQVCSWCFSQLSESVPASGFDM